SSFATANAENIRSRVSGRSRQLMPANNRWETACPAPKQSKTVQPRNPRDGSVSWMVHEKRPSRCRHGDPAGLSSAKSEDLVNPNAVQHSAKHRLQSPRRSDRWTVGDGDE